MTTWRNRLLGVLLGLSSVAVAADDPLVVLQVERVGEATPEAIAAAVEEAIGEMRDLAKSLAKLDDQSKPKGGTSMPCVENNLADVKTLLEAAEQAAASLDKAQADGDARRASTAARQIAVALKNTRALEAEAQRCVNGVDASSGKSRSQVDGGVFDPESDLEPHESDLLTFGYDPDQASPF